MTANKKALLVRFTSIFLLVGLYAISNKNIFPKRQDDAMVLEKSGHVWTFRKGTYFINEDLIVPLGVDIIIEAGAILKFASDRRFQIEEKLIAVGTADDPIVLTSQNKNEFWRGLRIRGRDTQLEKIFELKKNISEFNITALKDANPFKVSAIGSILKHVLIQNVSVRSPRSSLRLNYMASLEILNTEAKIKDVTFSNIQKVGLLKGFNSVLHITGTKALKDHSRKGFHINNSFAIITNNEVRGSQDAHICYDGIWALNSFIAASGNVIVGKGDDGIDLKNSFSVISKNQISDSRDEGIDVDHRSLAILDNNQIDVAENGIQVSGASTAYLIKNDVSGTNVGLFRRDARELFSTQSKYTNNGRDYLKTDSVIRPAEDQATFIGQDLQKTDFQQNDWNVPNNKVSELRFLIEAWKNESQNEPTE